MPQHTVNIQKIRITPYMLAAYIPLLERLEHRTEPRHPSVGPRGVRRPVQREVIRGAAKHLPPHTIKLFITKHPVARVAHPLVTGQTVS
eukprot:1187294-Prorocentrum_minimum.AAC.3